ncbi:MAG: hypothetical protein ABR591_14740, partial [Candidatus Velthaea sp.]
VLYTNPFRVSPPNDPLSNLPEGDWLHDSMGRRVVSLDGFNQNAVNPASPDAQAQYHALVANAAASAQYDFAEIDNVYFDIFGEFWDFSGFPNYPVETGGSETGWINSTNQMISASALPTIIDGMSNNDTPNNGTSGSVTFMNNPNAAGGLNNEGCIESKDTGKTTADWTFDENTLLAMLATHKITICQAMSNADDTSPVRNFFYASWLLTYNANLSVAFADIAPTFNRNSYLFVYPEYEIVPTQPLQTAVTNISELQVGSVYRREFGMCYQAQEQLAPCATIVNPTTSAADISSLVSGYTESMRLSDGLDTWNGGKATWSNGVPTSLPPHTAVIVLKAGPASTSGTLVGTLATNDGSYLVVQGCPNGSFVNAFYNTSTPIVTNGLSLTPGVGVTISGPGSCSTSYQATSIVLGFGSKATFTLTGTVHDLGPTWILVNSISCAYEYVDTSAATAFSGLPLAVGRTVTATGPGDCATRVRAETVVVK